MGIENKDFILYVAAYLYSLSDDCEGMGQDWHVQYFINIYNKYKDSEHNGDCTQQPWSCWVCFIDEYIDLATTMINEDSFNLYLEELKQ